MIIIHKTILYRKTKYTTAVMTDQWKGTTGTDAALSAHVCRSRHETTCSPPLIFHLLLIVHLQTVKE